MGSHRRRKWRIGQLLSALGKVSSKLEAVELARSGKITVDGKVVESLHFQVNPRKQELKIDGKKVELEENRVYFIFNKTKGVVCTKENIIKFINVDEELKKSLNPVGRLDKNTTGLIIITNDGRLAKRVLDPKTLRKKVYVAEVEGRINEAEAEKLRKGVIIDLEQDNIIKKYKTLPAIVKVIGSDSKKSIVEVSITEGKKRQVRKMFEFINHKVLNLKRIRIANLELGGLKDGKSKQLSKEFIFKKLFE